MTTFATTTATATAAGRAPHKDEVMYDGRVLKGAVCFHETYQLDHDADCNCGFKVCCESECGGCPNGEFCGCTGPTETSTAPTLADMAQAELDRRAHNRKVAKAGEGKRREAATPEMFAASKDALLAMIAAG